MAAISAIARLTFYTTTCVSVPFLRKKVVAGPEVFRLPGGPVIPILATVASLIVIFGADVNSMIWGGLALAAGAVFYLFAKAVRN